MRYCALCGNEPAESNEESIGLDCLARISNQWLALPYAYWKECGERYSMCCGGMTSDKKGFYFHGDGWECSYPLTKQGRSRKIGPVVAVEMGVRFELKGAPTYYIRDFGDYSDSQDFGDLIQYPDSIEQDNPEMFWKALDNQLDLAAFHAWNDGLRSRSNGEHEVKA